ncbi:MAG: hypothetical protein AB7S36_11500 [Planctomycetota bacterium]
MRPTPALLFALLALVMMLLPGTLPATHAQDSDEPADGQLLTLAVHNLPRYVEPWAVQSLEVTLTNHSDQWIAVIEVASTRSNHDGDTEQATLHRHTARAAGSDLVVTVIHKVDDVGAAARMPMPDKWETLDHKSDDRALTTFELLPPGDTLTMHAQVRFMGSGLQEVHVGASCALLGSADDAVKAGLMVLHERSVEKPADNGERPFGSGNFVVAGVHHWKFRAATAAELASPPALNDEPLAVGTSAMGIPTVDRFALTSEQFATVKVGDWTADATTRCYAVPYDLPDARMHTGLSDGRYTRAVTAGAWVLYDRKTDASWFADYGTAWCVAGDWLSLVRRVDDGRPASLIVGELENATPPIDPSAATPVAELFRQAGYRIDVEALKGGGQLLRVELDADNLTAISKLCAEHHVLYDNAMLKPDTSSGGATPTEAANTMLKALVERDAGAAVLASVMETPGDVPLIVPAFRATNPKVLRVIADKHDAQNAAYAEFTWDFDVDADLLLKRISRMLHARAFSDGLRGEELEHYDESMKVAGPEIVRQLEDGLGGDTSHFMPLARVMGRWYASDFATPFDPTKQPGDDE